MNDAPIAPHAALGAESSRPPFLEPQSPRPVLLPFLALLLLTLVTQLGSLTYNMWAAARAPDAAEQSLLFSLIFGAIILCALTIPLAGLGLCLGRQVGLGAPLLTDLLGRRPPE